MTVIKGMRLKGFKSFPKLLDLPFTNGFSAVIGPNGAGKCVHKDTLIQLADGSLVKIGDLVEKKFKENKFKKIEDGFIIKGDGTKVLSLSKKDLKIVSRPINAYVKRKSSEFLLKIITRSGREITTTEYHPLFILDNNKIRSIRAEELEEGIRVAVPRKIYTKPKTKYFNELLDLIEPKEKIYVPYDDKFKEILYRVKGHLTWRELSKKINVPIYVFLGIRNDQAVNFAYLVRILRKHYNDKEIIKLIPYVKSKNHNNLYKVPWKNSSKFARSLGYLLAEGRLPPKSNQIWFTNGTEEIVRDYKKLMGNIFRVRTTVNEYKANCWDVLSYSMPIRKILTKFGMPIGNTEDKKVTNLFLSHSADIEISEFLNGLYCGDGYISKSSIGITTKSSNLASAIENMLSRLGINFISEYIVKVATNSGFSGIYKNITIYGVDNFKKFSENIKLSHKGKRKRLELLLDKKSNPNLDLIEANSLVKDVVQALDISVKGKKKEFPRLDAYCYNQCLPSVYGVNYLINSLFLPVSTERNIIPQSLILLRTLSESDIYWDEIVEIKKIKPRHKWVYDLSIEKDHNFIANNFFVHNSNIMDGFCFVLGKTSAKSLRAEKSANLIYNGGKKGNPSKEAQVDIIFDNADKKFSSKEKELKISRIVRQSGNSIYKINNKTVTRQQVIDLLGSASINPDGHNIVLQGDIARFMEMKPVERREILEEIAGISIYENKKQKAMHELEKAEAKLNEANIILTEREAYLRELKKERDQALKYRELEKNIKDNKATYISLQIKDKTARKEDIENKIKNISQEIKSITNKIDQLKKAIEEDKAKINKINEEVEQRGEVEQKKLHESIEDLKTNIVKDDARLETCNTELKKLDARKESLEKNIKEVNDKISELNKEREALNKKIKLSIAKENDVQSKIINLKEKFKITDLEKLEEDIEKKQSELERLNNNKQETIRQKDKIEFGISNLKIADDKELSKLNGIRNEFKRTISELTKALNENSVINSQLVNVRKNLVEKNENLAKLRSKQIGIKASILDNLAIKKILDLKDKGIYGTISDLGKVNNKYSLALGVAAGHRVKSIVVENDVVAAKCIKYLKDNRLGVVTFLPLNKVKSKLINSEVRKLLNLAGVKGLAIDLISFDNKFRDVFSYVFSNTLVVDNLDTARKIGIGRTRMVTLEGDLLETSGAMIGGYRKRVESFKEKETEDNLNKIELEVNKLGRDLSLFEKKKDETEELISKLKEQKAELGGEIIRYEKSLNISNLDELKNRKKSLTTDLKKSDNEIEVIENNINKISKELEQLKSTRKSFRFDSKLDSEFGKLEKERQNLREEIIKFEAEIKNINAQGNDIYLKEIEKTNNILKENEREKESFVDEANALRIKLKKDKLLLKEKESIEKKFYTEFKNLFSNRNKLNESIQKRETLIVREEEKIKGLEYRTNSCSIDKAKVIAELEALNEEFKEFQDAKIRRNISLDDLKYEIKKFENLLQNLGNVNLRALEVYENVEKEYKKILEKVEKLKLEKEDVLEMMQEIDSRKKAMFMKTFNVLNKNFKNIFSSLSTKGDAHLDLEDENDLFNTGIDIKVRIIGNKFLDIKSLSGGEKTLTALAFIFAIQEYQPASFYLLDEVDATLDKTNSELLSKLLQKYSRNAQYIVVSHNDAIIGEADQVYGVSMQNEISKVVSLKI